MSGMAGMSSESMAPTPPKVIRLCNAVIRWTLLVLTFLVPLFFLPWTIEVSELNKQLLLLVGAGVAGIAWLGKMLAERKFEYRRSVVNLIVLLFLAVYAVSSWFSTGRYMSVAGDFGQEKAGLVTVLAFVILYFVAANNIRTMKALRDILWATIISGFLVALYALLQGLGVYILPFEFAKTPSFNTVGTAAALGIYLAYLVTLCGGLLLMGHGQSAENKKKMMAAQALLVVTAVVSLFLIAVIDFWPLTVCLLVANAVLIAFAFVHAGSMKGIGGILLPVATLIISVLLLFIRFPVSLGYPAEVMPSVKASADIALKTLRERPLFGSGPGTFLFDYSKHRASEVNQTVFWNIRFDRAAIRVLSLLATTGLFGTLSWLMVAVFLLVSAGRKLAKADEEIWHVLVAMFASWFLLVLAKFLYSSTMALEFATWMTMALLVVVHRKDFFSVKFEQSPRSAMILSFVFIFSLVFALSGLFVEGLRFAGEVEYAKAIRADRAGGEVQPVIDHLTRAASLNQQNDVYLRNLALAFLIQADSEFAKPVDVKKEEGEKDEDYQKRVQAEQQEQFRKVSVATANAVNTAKRASDLNPANVANWSVLGSIYQNLMGVTEGADGWAEKSYEKSIDLEPTNPALHTELGKVYVYQSDLARQATESKDEKVKADAQKKTDELLSKAVDAFNKAVELKADYAPAHYNLALAFDRQGKLKEAIQRMEAVVTLNNQDVGVGFQLALLYYRDEKKDAAIKLLESVVQLAPNYSNARWYLAAMYEEKKDLDGAIAQIEKVKELNPDNELVAKKLDELKKAKEAPAAPAPEQLPPPVEQPVQNPQEPGVKR
jgi:tetratricopeptide (TPR) repeat protein